VTVGKPEMCTPRCPRILLRRSSGNRHENTTRSTSCRLTPCGTSNTWRLSRISLSQKREGFETITGFPASIGACPSLGDNHPRFLLLPTGSRSQYGETARVDKIPCVIKQPAGHRTGADTGARHLDL